MPIRNFVVTLLLAVFGAGCAAPVTLVPPREWTSTTAIDSIVDAYRPFLAGHTIFLDPGHGGEDRVNRGPAGDAIEADVNLRVALSLRALLARAGAAVVMSRDRDTSVALADRAVLATSVGAELFISLHHNATGTGDNITNYSSVYYHARPGLPGFHPANHDIARYIQRDMSYAMRNPSSPSSPTFDGTLSDFDIYPNSGFAVLRAATIPAILIEGSFFTHPHEERRLAMEEFNRIEAWGVFLGIGRYFRSGFPRLILLSDTTVAPPWMPLSIGITGPGLPDPGSFDVSIDRRPLLFTYDTTSKIITAFPDTSLTSGVHTLSAIVRAAGGNASWPFTRPILVMLPAESLAVTCSPSSFPREGNGVVRLICRAFDRKAMSVVDGMPVRISGPGMDTTIGTSHGASFAYLRLPPGLVSVRYTASIGTCTTAVSIGRSMDAGVWRGGTVRGEDDGLPLPGVEACAIDSTGAVLALDSTLSDGRYGLLVDEGRVAFLNFRKTGFHNVRTESHKVTPGQERDVPIPPVAGKLLFGKTYLIDSRYGGRERGDIDSTGLSSAAVNLEVALRAAALLRAAGANAVLVRPTDTTIAESERVRFSALFVHGMYLRIDAGGAPGRASSTIFPSVANRQFAASILAGERLVARLDAGDIAQVRDRFHTDVALGTVTLILPSPRTGMYRVGAKSFDDAAWGILLGALESEGFLPDTTDRQVFLDPKTGLPRIGIVVVLDGIMERVTGPNGEAEFFGARKGGKGGGKRE